MTPPDLSGPVLNRAALRIAAAIGAPQPIRFIDGRPELLRVVDIAIPGSAWPEHAPHPLTSGVR